VHGQRDRGRQHRAGDRRAAGGVDWNRARRHNLSAIVPDATPGAASATDNCSVAGILRSGVPAGNVFPVGMTTVTYTATDGSGNMSSAGQSVTILDNTPPSITGLAASPSALWPPNQKLVPVAVSYTAADNCSPSAPIACSIAVTSSRECAQCPAAGGARRRRCRAQLHAHAYLYRCQGEFFEPGRSGQRACLSAAASGQQNPCRRPDAGVTPSAARGPLVSLNACAAGGTADPSLRSG